MIEITWYNTNTHALQRQEVRIAYKAAYGKDLMKTLKSELGGKFEALILAAMEEPAVYDAETLRHVNKALGCSNCCVCSPAHRRP
jgi:annexin A7/11